MENTSKKKYTAPKVEKIVIDNNISLVMMSLPPGDPLIKVSDNTSTSQTPYQA